MKKTKRLTALLLAGLMTLTLAACGGDKTPDGTPAPTASPSAAPSPSAPPDRDLTVCLGGVPMSMDPTGNTTADETMMLSHLFEGLTRWTDSGRTLADGVTAAQISPGMAQSYEKTPGTGGGVTYTFHLRAAKWSDGKPVTAHDFVYSWQRLADPANGAELAYLLDCVSGAHEIAQGQAQVTDLAVKAVDDKTLEVTLVRDVAWFPQLCALPVTAPLRQDVIEANGSQWVYDPATYVTNGPYKLKLWEDNSQLILEKNPDYYEPVTGPETIAFRFRGDEASALAAYEAGELDFLRGVAPTQGEPGRVPRTASYYLVFQNKAEPFDDPLVRQAFSLAVDRSKLVSDHAPGSTPAGALVPNGVYGDQGAAGAEFRAGEKGYLDPSADAYAANCEKARTLLSQAGYPGGAGFPEVTYLCPKSAVNTAIGNALAEMWQRELGVSVKVDPREWGEFLGCCHRGEFGIARGRWSADYNDPSTFLELWRTGGEGNDAGYGVEEYDRFLDQAAQAADPARRMELFHQAEGLLIGRDHALAPVYFEGETFLLGEGVTGVRYSPLGYFLFTGCQKG